MKGGGADAALRVMAGRRPKTTAGWTQRVRAGFSKENP
jgi:hypothetical protein